jgi:aminoglycoside 2'-N-acetyltransferase I
MVDQSFTVQEAPSAELSASDLGQIRRLMDEAFGDRFSDDDWSHALGGTHFVVRDPQGTIVSHASVVRRRLEVSGRGLATGYVEAVATRPRLQRRGLATGVMRAVAGFIRTGYELGALSSGSAFYERLGWLRWRGPTWCRAGDDVVRTTEEDGGVLVLPVGADEPLDLDGDIVADWRTGDVW